MMPILASTPDVAQAVVNQDLLIIAVAVVALAIGVGVFVIMRRSSDDDERIDYSDDAYDPQAEAALARARQAALPPEAENVAEALVDAPGDTGESASSLDAEADEKAPEPTIDPAVLAAEKRRVEAEKKALFEARKKSDEAARQERRAARQEDQERAVVARRENLAEQRRDFEAERRAAYRIGLTKTRQGFLGKIGNVLRGASAVDEALLDELEAILFTSDIGARTADRLLEELKTRRQNDRLKTADEVVAVLRESLRQIVDLPAATILDGVVDGHTKVVMVVGVNGVGKTTSMGKLAHLAQEAGNSVLLGAGDTFRAAAVDQLEVWAERTGSQIVRGADGADPSSVLFDAVKTGVEAGVDLVICDTAGRLHTRAELMDELKKMHRVMGKAAEGAPHEVILVLDATIGQNAIAQARTFVEAVPVDGIILTKLDGTARGGVIAGICDELKIPVRYVGVGEGLTDLRQFIADDFVETLFESLLETA